MLVKHQLVIRNRGRKRAPNLRTADRVIAGLCCLFMHRARIVRSAITLKPSTLRDLQASWRNESTAYCFSLDAAVDPGRKDQPRS